MNIDFIKDPLTLAIIEEILTLAGPSYSAPYDSDVQPSDGVDRNDEDLTQYDVPGGTIMKSVQMPADNPGMGTVIGSVLSVLAPIISAYGFILPILGIIKAIIEIMCCLMNPFCVVPALIRLFKKYLPPFISLFPPAAGLIFLKSTIKLILAVIFFIMTEVVPTVQFIISLCQCVITASKDKNKEKSEACKQKLLALLILLLNKVGILAVLKPLVELIMGILQLVAGIPCGSGKESSKKSPSHGPQTPFDGAITDTPCDGEQCPEEISRPPSGSGTLVRTSWGDGLPGWTWQLIPITGQANVPKLRPYIQDLKSQLDPQLDEPVAIAKPIGAKNDAAHFLLRILGRRGEKFCVVEEGNSEPQGSIVVPIADITAGNVFIINNYKLHDWEGTVDYCVEPNYEQLIGQSILAVGCHPEIQKAKDDMEKQFGDIMERSALDRVPEVVSMADDLAAVYDGLKDDGNGIKEIVDKPVEDYSLDDIPKIEALQNSMLDRLKDFADDLKGYLNILGCRMVDKVITTFEVDRNIVKASTDPDDKAIIMVTPRDVTGTPLMRNMPEDTELSVELFTDFGTLQNQQRDTDTGIITAELTSPFPGIANVMTKVCGEFVMTSFEAEATVKIEQVRFIADAVLPKRRLVSKSQTRTGITSEREPGSR